MKYIVAFTGGRDYSNKERVREVLVELKEDISFIVVGDAKELDILTEVHFADWERYGKSAGPIRNQAMINCNPKLVIAFPGGCGTANMVGKAKQAGIKVLQIKES